MDPAATYVALSRATCLENLYLLFPVTLRDLTRPRNKDVVALIDFLHRLEKATLDNFTKDPANFVAATGDGRTRHDGGTDNNASTPPRLGRNGNRTRPRRPSPSLTAHLMPNQQNACFFNSAIALCLGAFDGQALPAPSNCTPPAAAFFTTLQLIREAMFHGTPLQEHVLVGLEYVE